jgi:hypothetical protein
MKIALTFAYNVRWVLSHTFSTGRLASPVAQDAGGDEFGSASGAKLMPENACSNRMRNKDTSLYANYGALQY